MVEKTAVEVSGEVKFEIKTIFMFVPGCARARGNERAGRLAVIVTADRSRSMDRSDILHVITEAGRSNISPRDKECVTKAKLHEHQVKGDVAR
jgi:hypothetical protein